MHATLTSYNETEAIENLHDKNASFRPSNKCQHFGDNDKNYAGVRENKSMSMHSMGGKGTEGSTLGYLLTRSGVYYTDGIWYRGRLSP